MSQSMPPARLLLRSYDRYARAGVINPVTGEFALSNEPIDDPLATDGWFVRRRPRLMALYVHHGSLWFHDGTVAYDLRGLIVRRRSLGPVKSIQLLRNDVVVTNCRYLDSVLARRWFIPAALDESSFTADADFNWAQFVEDIGNDPGRAARIVNARGG